MIIEASTPVGGYAPGQTINLQIHVDNQSKESVSKFSVKLVKVSYTFQFKYSIFLSNHFVVIKNATIFTIASDLLR